MKKEYKDEIELAHLWIFKYSILDFIFLNKCIILNSQFSFQGGCSALEIKAIMFLKSLPWF